VSWTSTGWTHGRKVERMLDIPWKQGLIMVAGRDGQRRLWGLAESPAAQELPQEEVVRRNGDRIAGVIRRRGLGPLPRRERRRRILSCG
jgi:hypothetical protein